MSRFSEFKCAGLLLMAGISSSILFTLPAAAQTPKVSPASSVGLYVYPQKQQTPAQQTKDETECYSSAKQQSGVDPTAAPPLAEKPATQAQGATAKGAAGGAAGGAAIGAIAGDAGKGAAIGATAGAVRGHRAKKKANKTAEQQAQSAAQGQHTQQLDSFKRAMSACLDARSYSVK
ncbi:MAG TPA: glycine zipper family protein [Silvibacterium sp.]|nr:glycine zipper family protein [Silvibacterium sp.]